MSRKRPPRSARPPAPPRDAGGLAQEPPPWSLRGLATLMLIVVLLQAPFAALLHVLHGDAFAYGLVAVDPIRPFVSCLVAMPFAQRLAGEDRPMRVLETLSVGAVLLILTAASGNLALDISGHALDENDGKQLAGLAVAELVAAAATVVVYPVIYRRFFMPRRRRGV